MFHALFSFKGRLNRAPYWGYSILMVVLILVPFMVYAGFIGYQIASQGAVSEAELTKLINQRLFWPMIAVLLATLWPSTALMAKRLQDHDKSGALALPLMVPGIAYNMSSLNSPDSPVTLTLLGLGIIVGLFSFVYLGCMRGTVGPNRFGNDPLDRHLMPSNMQAV